MEKIVIFIAEYKKRELLEAEKEGSNPLIIESEPADSKEPEVNPT